MKLKRTQISIVEVPEWLEKMLVRNEVTLEEMKVYVDDEHEDKLEVLNSENIISIKYEIMV